MSDEKTIWKDFYNKIQKVKINELEEKKEFDELIVLGYDAVIDVCAARKKISNTANRTPIVEALSEEEKETGVTGMCWCLYCAENQPKKMLLILATGQCSNNGNKTVGPKSHWKPAFKKFYEDLLKLYTF